MEFARIVKIPPRVLLSPMTCPMDPWKIHSRIVVLANTVGIIWILAYGAQLESDYLFSLGICILQALNII